MEEQLRFFPLAFSTVEKNFTVTVNPVTCDLPDGNTYTLTGTLVTSDFIDPQEVEKYLTASTGRRSEKITWDHDNNNNHTFTIEKIQRGKEESELTVAWNGNSVRHKNQGRLRVLQFLQKGSSPLLKSRSMPATAKASRYSSLT